MSDDSLRLRAVDPDDLAVVAAVLQDALVPLTDMQYLAGDKRFVLVANRFRWENCDATGACDQFERVHCAVAFEGVDRVERQGLDRCCLDGIGELLTIEVADGAVLLVFAGGGRVRLGISRLDCHIRDVGEPWPTQWRPRHPDDAGPAPASDPKGGRRTS
ncbi:MAG: DUF2948 family protein [Candidatus Eiseniibacteriota bacterium]